MLTSAARARFLKARPWQSVLVLHDGTISRDIWSIDKARPDSDRSKAVSSAAEDWTSAVPSESADRTVRGRTCAARGCGGSSSGSSSRASSPYRSPIWARRSSGSGTRVAGSPRWRTA